jgi:hypothetical protein
MQVTKSVNHALAHLFTCALVALMPGCPALGIVGDGVSDDDARDGDGDGDGDSDGGEGEGEAEGDLGVLADAAATLFDRCFTLEQVFGDAVAVLEPAWVAQFEWPTVNLTGGPVFIVFGVLFVGTDRDELLAHFEAQTNNPALEFRQAAYDACLAVLTSPTCPEDVWYPFHIRETFSACKEIFSGVRAVGEGCGEDFECAGGGRFVTFCDQPDEEQCGVCAALPGDAEPCADDRCRAGLVCNDDNTCVPLPGHGEPCSLSCAEGLICNEVDVCEPIRNDTPREGDPCVVDSRQNSCDPFATALFCDPTDNTCQPITIVAPGGTCDPEAGFFKTANYCRDQVMLNACLDPEADGTFICTALPGIGRACVQGRCAHVGALGVATTGCDETDTCVVLPGEGQACVDFRCADPLVCDENNICVVNPLVDLEGPVCPSG